MTCRILKSLWKSSKVARKMSMLQIFTDKVAAEYTALHLVGKQWNFEKSFL